MNRHSFLFWAVRAGMACLLVNMTSASAAEGPVYEMRTYVAAPGKFDALLARFRDHTCRLFEKHGIENIGYWIPLEEADGANNTLVYMLRHKSRDAAKASFAAMGKDPEWQKARAASEAGGKLLAQPPQSVFMTTTDYSPAVKAAKGDQERVFEMRTYNTPPGKLEALHERFRSHTMKLFSKHGMSHFGYWVPLDEEKGAGHKLVYILTHPSKEAGLAAFATFRADPEWIKAKAASEEGGSLTLPQPEGVKSVYMRAADFSPTK